MAERSERVAPFRATHRAPELLAPAGGPDPFNAALAAGADAIYCGLGTDFNARRGARNFDDETFAAACRAGIPHKIPARRAGVFISDIC